LDHISHSTIQKQYVLFPLLFQDGF